MFCAYPAWDETDDAKSAMLLMPGSEDFLGPVHGAVYVGTDVLRTYQGSQPHGFQGFEGLFPHT
jgi:hypothetical protein